MTKETQNGKHGHPRIKSTGSRRTQTAYKINCTAQSGTQAKHRNHRRTTRGEMQTTDNSRTTQDEIETCLSRITREDAHTTAAAA